MSERYEDCVAEMADEELIKALRGCLPEKIPYGEMVGADYPYTHMGPSVYMNQENYFIEEAAKRLERNIPTPIEVWATPSGFTKRYYCPVCHKQQKKSKTGIWYCERCGQALTR